MNFGGRDVDVVIKVFNSRKNELNDKYELFMKEASNVSSDDAIKAIINKLNPKVNIRVR